MTHATLSFAKPPTLRYAEGDDCLAFDHMQLLCHLATSKTRWPQLLMTDTDPSY